ncbi:MAG: hypothetical protein II393_00265 [Cytophagales bacterium]|nr:hypothetical protein [Cytophagales bacterium]
MEKDTLALEMMKELKTHSKRWFIIAIIELIIIIITNACWLIYNSQFEEITTDEQVIEDIDNSNNSTYTQTIN